MNPSTYSNEELQQLFQNLFQEKKKFKELEQKFQSLNEEHTKLLGENSKQKTKSPKKVDADEVEKLKNMVAMYKKKSAQAIHALYENEQQKVKQETTLAQQLVQAQSRIQELTDENLSLLEQQKDLKNRCDQLAKKSAEKEPSRRQKEQIEKFTTVLQERDQDIKTARNENLELSKAIKEAKTHGEQLERALKLLRDRSQEAQLELNQYRDESRRSQEAITNLTEQLKLEQSKIRDLSHELEIVKTEKKENQEELEILQGQFSALKAKILSDQDEIMTLKREKAELEQSLNEKSSLLSQLETEVFSIRNSLTKGMSEAKNIEARHLELINEKAVFYNRSTQLQKLFEQQKEEIQTLQQQLLQANNREEDLKRENHQLQVGLATKHQDSLKEQQQRLQELELHLHKHQDHLRQKEQQIEGYTNQISQLTQEKYKLEEALSNMTRQQDEQEARIKVAQQHLGKKVKEVALLNEKIEDQKHLVAESQDSINQLRSKMNEMQFSFDMQLQQEKKLQEQLHETVRFSESQIIKWEEKYLQAYEKLKTLEEKQQQMQTLFSSLGSVLGNQLQPISQPTAPRSTPVPQSIVQNKNTIQLVDTASLQSQTFVEEEPSKKEEPSSYNPLYPSLFDIEQQPRNKTRQSLFD